ncbi:MAG: flavodoxin family protein [Tissierellia bacterium]|nr:flavodoxin family protein [Tissierellia bacterium]
MKGIIIYSSKTGNTKKMAEYLANNLKKDYIIDIFSADDLANLSEYDFLLLGGWVDKGHLDKKAMKILKRIDKFKIGIFGTIGAMPNSAHGLEVKGNLENLIADKYSLGVYLCPGTVDPKLIKQLEGLAGKFMPSSIKKQILEVAYVSREATEAELHAAFEFFKSNLEKLNS